MLLIIPLVFSCKKDERKEIVYISKAVQQAANENKLLIIEFWAPSCGPCIRLKRDIFENQGSKEFLEKNFLVLKISPADSIYSPLYKHFKLAYQSTVIYIDKKGNELDRTVSYDGNRDAYLNFMKDIIEGKNLYKDIIEAYQKDTLNAYNNYLLAKKLMFIYEFKNASKQLKNVLVYDPEDKLGLHAECKFKIAEIEFILTGSLDAMRGVVNTDRINIYIPKAYEYLIQDLINKKDKSSCISICQEAYNKYPGSWEILNKYAWAIYTFRIKEDYSKALKMAQKSISLNPERAGTYSTESWIYFEMGDKEKAIESVKKAIELYPHPSYKADLEKFQAN